MISIFIKPWKSWSSSISRPYSNKFYKHRSKGVYVCKVCNESLFLSSTKYDSGSGWPSFYDVVDKAKVTFRADASGSKLNKCVPCSCWECPLYEFVWNAWDRSRLQSSFLQTKPHLDWFQAVALISPYLGTPFFNCPRFSWPGTLKAIW